MKQHLKNSHHNRQCLLICVSPQVDSGHTRTWATHIHLFIFSACHSMWYIPVLGGSFCFLFICLFLAVMGLLCYLGFVSSCNVKASHCRGFSCCRARTLGARASVVVVHRLSCSTACGILPDQGSNPCLLRWQVDFLPMSYHGSPGRCF